MRHFSIESILTVVHGRLLCDMGEVYEICNFLSGDNLYTHQLPRAIRILGPWVLVQHPQLKDWDDSQVNEKTAKGFIAIARERFGIRLPLVPLHRERWTRINPLEELSAMVRDDKIILVEKESNAS